MYPDPHIISSLTAAAAFAAMFLLGSKCWAIAAVLIRRRSPFAALIRPEPGDYYRRKLQRIDARAGAHFAAIFIVVSVFLSLYFAGHQPWWSRFDDWTWWLIALILGALAGYEVLRVVLLLRSRRVVRHRLHAHVATGQRLEHVAARGNFLFHCVPVGDDRIDHVVVGTNGVYAIHVVVRARRRGSVARCVDGHIEFGDEEIYSLSDWQDIIRRLAVELRGQLGHSVRVMSVIVTPGWDIQGPSQSSHLLVNHADLTMLTGWRDQDAFLLDEEVEQLQRLFVDRSTA